MKAVVAPIALIYAQVDATNHVLPTSEALTCMVVPRPTPPPRKLLLIGRVDCRTVCFKHISPSMLPPSSCATFYCSSIHVLLLYGVLFYYCYRLYVACSRFAQNLLRTTTCCGLYSASITEKVASKNILADAYTQWSLGKSSCIPWCRHQVNQINRGSSISFVSHYRL